MSVSHEPAATQDEPAHPDRASSRRYPICPECLESIVEAPSSASWSCPACGLRFMLEEAQPATYTVCKVTRRRQKRPRPIIEGPIDLYGLVKPLLAHQDREHFYAVLLSTKHHVLAVELIAVGSLSGALVHPREVFKLAIAASAAAIVLAHNHPSGVADPSPEDQTFTHRLARAGELLGIRVLDHVIVAGDEFVSLKERGAL